MRHRGEQRVSRRDGLPRALKFRSSVPIMLHNAVLFLNAVSAQLAILEVRRYDGQMLAAELGPKFELLESMPEMPEMHVTPRGEQQLFHNGLFRRV
jgi:hypothetical protein